jgi:hypothetical protein
MNKSFEIIADGKVPLPYANKINAAFFLKMFGKLTEYKGKGIILRGISRKKSIVRRNDKWTL